MKTERNGEERKGMPFDVVLWGVGGSFGHGINASAGGWTYYGTACLFVCVISYWLVSLRGGDSFFRIKICEIAREKSEKSMLAESTELIQNAFLRSEVSSYLHGTSMMVDAKRSRGWDGIAI